MTKTHKADALLRLAAQWQHDDEHTEGGLADAKAQGRREAFAEVLRNFEVLRGYDMVHPLATFLHWLDEAAK